MRVCAAGETFCTTSVFGAGGGPRSDPAPPARRRAPAGTRVIPSFANAHLPLDKVYTLSLAGEEPLQHYTGGQMGQAMTAIELAARVKDRYEEGGVPQHAHRAPLDRPKHGG